MSTESAISKDWWAISSIVSVFPVPPVELAVPVSPVEPPVPVSLFGTYSDSVIFPSSSTVKTGSSSLNSV